MVTPGQAQAIAELGPFALFVFITAFAMVGLWRRWIVLGWFYDQERTGRITAETQALLNAEALKTTNTALVAAMKELAGVKRETRGLRDELRAALSRLPDG